MNTTQQQQDIREKISEWLANPDCDTDFNALVNFLTDECGVVLKPEEEDEFNEVCDCGTKMSNEKLTEEECDEHPDREVGYDEEGEWNCSGCRDK